MQAESQTNYRYLVALALTAALGGFLFGYDTAVVSGAIGSLKEYFTLDADSEGLAASVMLLGCMFGAAVAGIVGDRLGRKWSLVLCGVLFAGSSVASAVPDAFRIFLYARFAGGIAIGAASMLSPLYIAEISPKKYRGMFVALYQLAIVVGILVVFFVNLQIQRLGDTTWNVNTGWRWMLASLTGPSLLFAGLMLFVPESPRWLMKVGRRDEAAAILRRVGGEQNAEREVAQIDVALSQEEGRWHELFTSGYRRAMVIGCGLAIFCQLSGINAIMYYAPEIFKAAGAETDAAFRQTVTVGAVNLLFTFVAIWLVDRAGRKPLLLIGSLVQVLSLGLVGLMYHQQRQDGVLLAGILIFVAAFAMAMGPIPWIINSEIFPTKLRGRAMSIAIVLLWFADFVVTQTFPRMRDGIGPAWTFWSYAGFSLAGMLFVAWIVPETKGRALEEIEASWRK